jgi:hypothetical protein
MFHLNKTYRASLFANIDLRHDALTYFDLKGDLSIAIYLPATAVY